MSRSGAVVLTMEDDDDSFHSVESLDDNADSPAAVQTTSLSASQPPAVDPAAVNFRELLGKNDFDTLKQEIGRLDAPELHVPKVIALSDIDRFLTCTDVTRSYRLDFLRDSIAKLATALETLLQQQHAERQQQEQAAERTATMSYLLHCLGSNDAHPDFEFARYVAQCAVIDSRVLSLQLTHCNDDLLRTRLESLFVEKRLVAIRQLLLQQPNAQAVKTKLDAKRISFDDVKSLESAVRLEQNSSIGESLWKSVVLFFMTLEDLRARNGNTPSELFLSIEAGRVFFPPFFNYDRTKMNQAIFSAEQKDDLLKRLFENTVLVDEMNEDNAAASVDFAYFVDMCLRVVGEIKQHGDAGDVDRRRLIVIQVLHCILSAGTSSSVPAAPATSVVATPDRKVSFGLQFIGLRVQLTVLVPVNAVLSVNLLLFDFDFKTCSMAQAVEYLATMIGIAEANATLDVSIRNALFDDAPEALKAQRDEFNETFSHHVGSHSTPPPSNTNQRFAVRDVTAGTIAADRGAHTIVRSSDGAAAFKVVPVDVHARSRTDAVNELRVHMLLTRHARKHVVPLLAHFDAHVTLPGQQRSRTCIVSVMPFVESVDVDELRDTNEVAMCVSELLGALAALHRLGVLHGDAKWSNTLWISGAPMQGRRRLVLCDFGLSVQLDVDGGATLRRGVGTSDYMAPEVSNGSALSVTASADVYSAGVSLSELAAHAECEALQTLVRSMCAQEPCDRPSASEAQRVWRDSVVPALEQQTPATAVVDGASAPAALVIARETQPAQQSPAHAAATKKVPLAVVDREQAQTPPPNKMVQPTSVAKKFGQDRTNTLVRAGLKKLDITPAPALN